MNGHRVNAFQEPKPEETILLRWEDGDYASIAVRCRKACSLGLYHDLSIEVTTLPEMLKRVERFATEVLLEWNLDGRDGKPLPATSEGLAAIPTPLVVAILQRYFEVVAGIPGPLGGPSSNGRSALGTSPEKSTPPVSTSASESGSARRRTRSRAGP